MAKKDGKKPILKPLPSHITLCKTPTTMDENSRQSVFSPTYYLHSHPRGSPRICGKLTCLEKRMLSFHSTAWRLKPEPKSDVIKMASQVAPTSLTLTGTTNHP